MATITAITPSLLFQTGEESYWEFDGSNDLLVSDRTANFAGDFQVDAHIRAADWTPAANSYIASKMGASGNYAWGLRLATTGALVLVVSTDGSATANRTSTVALGTTAGLTDDVTDCWVRVTVDVDDGAGNDVVKFYYSNDGSSWTQLGSTVTTASGGLALYASTHPLLLGGRNTASVTAPFDGRIYQARFYSSIGGATVARPRASEWTSTDTDLDDSIGVNWALQSATLMGGWQDISEYLKSYAVRWGRNSSFDDMRARTLTLVLHNADRRFEPGYTSGAYYPAEMAQGSIIQLAITFTLSAGAPLSVPLFYGTVERIALTYPGTTDTAAQATITASDPLTILAQDLIWTSADIASDVADEMAKDCLALCQWTAGTISTAGVVASSATLQAFAPYGETILSCIQKIAHSEGYIFYMLPSTDEALAYLVDPWHAFAADATLTQANLTSATLEVEADQLATRVKITAQPNDIGAATYDEAGGTVDDQWTKTAHGLADLQEVWFSAVGGGATGYAVDTHYWVIWRHANYFQLASSLANAVADTQIAGTGDSTGTWTIRVAGEAQAASFPAKAAAFGERTVSYDESLLFTDAEVSARCVQERNRRNALRGTLRPTSMTAKIAVGDTADVDLLTLVLPWKGISLAFDPGTGASRTYEVYTQGGQISHTPGAPLAITVYTEAASQWEV